MGPLEITYLEGGSWNHLASQSSRHQVLTC